MIAVAISAVAELNRREQAEQGQQQDDRVIRNAIQQELTQLHNLTASFYEPNIRRLIVAADDAALAFAVEHPA